MRGEGLAMFARRIKTVQPVDDKAGTAILQPVNVQAARSSDLKPEVLAARRTFEEDCGKQNRTERDDKT